MGHFFFRLLFFVIRNLPYLCRMRMVNVFHHDVCVWVTPICPVYRRKIKFLFIFRSINNNLIRTSFNDFITELKKIKKVHLPVINRSVNRNTVIMIYLRHSMYVYICSINKKREEKKAKKRINYFSFIRSNENKKWS
jgi:hypothetical protein